MGVLENDGDGAEWAYGQLGEARGWFPAVDWEGVPYTYVSLMLGRVFVRAGSGIWLRTRWVHHATPAYLVPELPFSVERRAHARLGDVVRHFVLSRPAPVRRHPW